MASFKITAPGFGGIRDSLLGARMLAEKIANNSLPIKWEENKPGFYIATVNGFMVATIEKVVS